MMNARNAGVHIRPTGLFWSAISLLIVVSAVALFSSLRLMNQYESSSRSHQALRELGYFLSALKDVESGARGYVISRDPRYLDTHRAGQSEVRLSLERLGTLAATEDVLARDIAALGDAAARRAAISAEVIDLVDQGNATGELLATVSAGKRAMDEVHQIVGRVSAEQQATYALRREAARSQAAIANLALGVGVALSLVVLMWLFVRLSREIQSRRAIEEEIRILNTDLEQRVNQRTAEVQRNRQLLDTVIANMPDVLFLKDAGNDFRYVMMNNAIEKLLGLNCDEFIGRADFDIFPAEEAEQYRREDEAVISSSQPLFVSERSIATQHGNRIIEYRKVPFTTEDGDSKYILCIARDLTESKQLETQVREMQRLDAVGLLTGGIAHDFNNLLAVIVGSVELVREKLPDESEMAKYADEAINAAMRGADLVRRLLAFARKQHLDPVAVDLNERLQSIVPLLERTLGETIKVQVNSPKNLWPARIDPTQFDDALVNMSINARDAMPGGGTLTIETANIELDEDYAAHHMEVEPGEYVMLAVSDTGAGMPPEVIARAFEPFFTTKEEGKGTGLGLSQVFGWVKQSGGHIKIYSELDHGTTIKLYLPRASAVTRETAAQPAEETSTRGHETILVVEDNPNVRRTVGRQLADLGYTVLEAENGESAIALIESGEPFDLMLTDVVMPGGISGYDLAEAAEAMRPSCKVLFTSGYTALAASGRRPAGKGTLLSKPYSKRKLGQVIRSALDDEEIAPD
jgi:PAS domain S-box-containing protein